jgi:NhaP-type Na+/H+ or K+/H+ antiporter
LVPLLSAQPGLTFGDTYVLGLAFAGVAVFAAVGALSHQRERAFSASVIYLALGVAGAIAIEALGASWIDPVDDHDLLERLSELAVIVALFATGLRLDRPLTSRAWGSVGRLLLIVMPLTIAAVALFGHVVMDLPLGAAIILGAVLAPTDPVLAGDVGVGPPGDEDEREANFALTAEAGLNDGLAFPFVLLGAFVASEGGTGWGLEWLGADVLYAIGVALIVGAVAGRGIAAGILRLRDRDLLLPALDGWVAVGAVLLVYGACELAGGYGFLAVFVAGLAFRRYERDHELNQHVHHGAEMIEKFAELALILLLGSMLTLSGLSAPGWEGWLLVPLLFVVVRPLATLVGFAGSGLGRRDRTFIGWFGVRGVGSLYYGAAVLGLGVLTAPDQRTLAWTVSACVLCSILVHGISASPLARRWLDE